MSCTTKETHGGSQASCDDTENKVDTSAGVGAGAGAGTGAGRTRAPQPDVSPADAAYNARFTTVCSKTPPSIAVVASYTQFDNLAHGPRGCEATYSMRSYELDPRTGRLTLLTIATDKVMNPAFLRFHPTKNLVYGCTESVLENGQLVVWALDPSTGALTRRGSSDAGGTSTCYVTIDSLGRHVLLVNYWDATIVVQRLGDDGMPGETVTTFDPKGGQGMHVDATKRVNHSRNDKEAQAQRQLDPHSHAVVLSPCGRIAYIPDLGMDVIRQLLYNPKTGSLTAVGSIRSGSRGLSLGPRYLHFHDRLPVCYVVNELASEVAVFRYSQDAVDRVVAAAGADGEASPPTLALVQVIRTVPAAFPLHMNTCGRIAVHESGRYVMCSNRGHDSVAVFRILHEHGGKLQAVSFQHTYGYTPRHFQFDPSGQWMVAANQDSDEIGVFEFHIATGELTFTGFKYAVPSPNFVCCVQPHRCATAK